MPLLAAPSALLALATGLACGDKRVCPPGSTMADDGLCYLDDDGSGDGGSSDGGAGDGGDGGSGDGGAPAGLEEGDPIELLGFYQDNTFFSEFTGVDIVDDQHAILVGVSGFAIADRDNGRWVTTHTGDRSNRVSVDGDRAWVITGDRSVYWIDVSDPTDPVVGEAAWGPPGSYQQDVSALNGLVAVAYGDDGIWLWRAEDVDAMRNQLTTIPGDDASTVALHGDDLFLTDGATLARYDMTDPSTPSLADSWSLLAGASDLAVSDDWVAVGLGGAGVQVFARSDAGLDELGHFNVPGAATGVSLDGDNLWVAAWDEVALALLTPQGPVVLGHETAQESAFGIAARDGRAMAADWFHSTAFAQVPGVGGAEIEIPELLHFQPGVAATQRLPLRNYGAFPLEVQLDDPGGGYTLGSGTIELQPGQAVQVLVDADGSHGAATVHWTSNDPDEPSGRVELSTSDQSIGTVHQPFEAQAFTWPDPSISLVSLEDFRGEVVFLAYWAVF